MTVPSESGPSESGWVDPTVRGFGVLFPGWVRSANNAPLGRCGVEGAVATVDVAADAGEVDVVDAGVDADAATGAVAGSAAVPDGRLSCGAGGAAAGVAVLAAGCVAHAQSTANASAPTVRGANAH
jgi:hypothetical protein